MKISASVFFQITFLFLQKLVNLKFSKEYYNAYKQLPERLTEVYPDLNFDNHCYLRIALDNTLGAKWDTIIERPAYKNLNAEQSLMVRELLSSYEQDKELLLEHNRKSLEWRKKLKKS
ncbi:acetyltransferase [Flavobacteriaceae bacterium M23B6Z8]